MVKWSTIYFDSVTSTNTIATERAAEGAPERTVIVAQSQTRGRGRQGRTWVSLPGSLLFSVILRPAWSPAHLGKLGFYACVAAALAAEGCGSRMARLKWPNDLWLPLDPSETAVYSKAGGVLVETAVSRGACDWAVVGIGVNVLPVQPDHVRDFDFVPSSVSQSAGRIVHPDALLNAFLDQFDRLYAADGPENWAYVLAEWRSRDMVAGQPVTVRIGRESIQGRAAGVDDEGALLLETPRGLRHLPAGDVQGV